MKLCFFQIQISLKLCILYLQDMLGADQAYEGLYGHGQAPPSVHSSHGGRMFQQGKILNCFFYFSFY